MYEYEAIVLLWYNFQFNFYSINFFCSFRLDQKHLFFHSLFTLNTMNNIENKTKPNISETNMT